MSSSAPITDHRLPSPLGKPRPSLAHPKPRAGSLRLVDRYLAQLHDPATSRADRTVLKLKIGLAESLSTSVYQTLRVADVVARAGAAYGSFYRYFTDLQHATVVVLQDLIDHSKLIYQEGARVETVYEAIYQSNLRFVRAYRENAGLMRALLALSEEVDDFRAIWDKVVDDWHERIARRIAQRRPIDDIDDIVVMNASLAAYCLGGMLDQICRQAFAQRNARVAGLADSDEHLASVISALWYRAVYAEHEPIVER